MATDHIYEGEVMGDRNSYVFGSLLNGVFEGKIITDRDAYYVEHAKRYFPSNFTRQQRSEPPLPPPPPQASALLQTTDGGQRETVEETTTTTTTRSSSSPSSSEDDLIRDVGFHSVIYKDSHVDDVYEPVRGEGKYLTTVVLLQ